MINEALSSNITKILSIEKLKKFEHLIKRAPFSEINFFPDILAVCIVQE